MERYKVIGGYTILDGDEGRILDDFDDICRLLNYKEKVLNRQLVKIVELYEEVDCMGKSKNKKHDGVSCISKKERKSLYNLIKSVDWFDEDSVFDLGVELGKYSVLLRSRVLESNDDDVF